MTPTWAMRELMVVADVAVYLRKSRAAARKWLKRHHLPLVYIGGKLAVDRRDLDRAIGLRPGYRPARSPVACVGPTHTEPDTDRTRERPAAWQ